MPLYSFLNPETEETQDVFYTMKEAPSLGAYVEIDGERWKRVATTSQLAMAGLKPIDPHSAKQFVEKTGKMKGSLGDLWDTSRELSEKRAAKDGKDGVKESYYREYSRKRRSTPHLSQLAEQQKAAVKVANEKMKKAGISISLT